MAFLNIEKAIGFPKSKYVELALDDDRMVYGAPLVLDAAGTIEDDSYTVIIDVLESDEGWKAVGWTTSGC